MQSETHSSRNALQLQLQSVLKRSVLRLQINSNAYKLASWCRCSSVHLCWPLVLPAWDSSVPPNSSFS